MPTGRAEGWNGGYYSRLMDEYGVQPKTVAIRTGIHASTLSRFFNGKQEVSENQRAQIGIAIVQAGSESSRTAK